MYTCVWYAVRERESSRYSARAAGAAGRARARARAPPAPAGGGDGRAPAASWRHVPGRADSPVSCVYEARENTI